MSFKERSAWIMVVALLISGIFYFQNVYEAIIATEIVEIRFSVLIVFTIILISAAIVGHTLIAVLNPEETDEASDERDKRVIEKAGHISGMVFGFLTITSLLGYVIFQVGSLLFYAVLGSLIIAQTFEYGLQIYFYRNYFE
jgi:hypothetical protein